MQLFSSVFEFCLFLMFSHSYISKNFPNFYTSVSFNLIYTFSNLQIQLQNFIAFANKLKLPSDDRLQLSFIKDNEIVSVLYGKEDEIKNLILSKENYDFVLIYKNNNTSILKKPKDTQCIFSKSVNYKFVLLELRIPGKDLIKFDLDNFMVANNLFDHMFLSFYFKHYHALSIPNEYEITMYDQHVNKQVLNEKKGILLHEDNYTIEPLKEE